MATKKEIRPSDIFEDLIVKLKNIYKDVYIFRHSFCVPGEESPDSVVGDLMCILEPKYKEAVEAFSTMYKEAVQKAVKDALKGKPPKAGNGGDKPSMTKEQILAVKNPSERQKLIAENITLFQ